MAKVLELFDRSHGYQSLQEGWHSTFLNAFSKDNHYTLFRAEDWAAWVTFSCVFFVLIVFDNVILNRNPHVLTVTSAVFYTLFWMLVAFGFFLWVCWWRSPSDGYMWMSGYILEWMLSFDNLFVFHLIFKIYATPDNLKHRPLYLGIMGAVVFRLVFIFIGEYLMHTLFFMHFIFGAFLIYTGIKSVTADEDDEDPSQQPLVVWLQEKVKFVPVYDSRGAFFVRAPVNHQGDLDIQEEDYVKVVATEESPIVSAHADAEDKSPTIGIVDFSKFEGSDKKMEWRATMLFLVVCCLEISDLLFAVDSVSAIVAQVNDLFLAYTSAVFAMLGLRATFFIIDVLVHMFALLKYGVAIVLVFVGVKLIVGKFYHIPASIVCVILITAIAGSMLASIIQEKFLTKCDKEMSPEIKDAVCKMKTSSPFPSPVAPLKKSPA